VFYLHLNSNVYDELQNYTFILTSKALLAQAAVTPNEVKDALVRISADAKDTIRYYTGKTDEYAIKQLKTARDLDSLAILNQAGNKLVEIYRNFNGVFEKLDQATRARIKGEAKANWIKYQTAEIISGGKWPYDRISTISSIFPYRLDGRTDRTRYIPDVEKKVNQLIRVEADKPLKVIESYPVDGAFNTYRNDAPDLLGHFTMSKNMESYIGFEKYFVAKWTSMYGETTYSRGAYEYGNTIFFEIPKDFMKGGTVYKLELATTTYPANLHDFYISSCYWGRSIYKYKPTDFIIEFGGLSTPLATIYFRTSKAKHALEQFEGVIGTFDNITKTYAWPLNELLDSIDVYGNYLYPARISIQDAMIDKSSYEKILHPVVANYLVTPRTHEIDTSQIKPLYPFEMAGLYIKEFVYKIDEKSGVELASINQEYDTKLSNDYVIHGTGKAVPKISVKGKIAPKITSDHFSKLKAVPTETCSLLIQSTVETACEKQHMEIRAFIEKRINERARFFYGIEKRHCMRNNIKMTRSLANFEAMERENLPPAIKGIMTEPIQWKRESTDFVFYGSTVLPGTDRRTSYFKLKIKS
jgi:hypothetical protein